MDGLMMTSISGVNQAIGSLILKDKS